MDVTEKHPWHEQLHQLDGFPLVACDGNKRAYQQAWQTKSLTPQQIIDEDCDAVGLRCGEDSEIVAFDLDGNTARERAIAAGCEPYEHAVHRAVWASVLLLLPREHVHRKPACALRALRLAARAGEAVRPYERAGAAVVSVALKNLRIDDR